jgi:uncharacterized protein
MLPFSIPLFPLPNVVLFPNVFLPLHIFEARYRQMVAESLAGDRIIGLVLLRPGYEAAYDGAPPIYATGCAGLITHQRRGSAGAGAAVPQRGDHAGARRCPGQRAR